MATIVLFGPPLPGRDVLHHALVRGLPAGTTVIVADLPTVAARRAVASGLPADERVVFVAREPTEHEAWREVFHHYAGLPAELAEARWDGFLADRDRREPTEGEVWPVIVARGIEPVAQVVAAVRRRVEPGAPPAPRVPRVLVVDDDDGQRADLGDALSHLGCEVTTAGSAEEALVHLRAGGYDLVVSDEHMPGASGTDLAAALTRLQPGLRVAIVTGFPDDAAAALARGPAVDIVLAKPLGIVDLVRLVDEMTRA